MRTNVTRGALSLAGLSLIAAAAAACQSASEQGSDRLELPAGPLQQALVTDGQSCVTVQRGASGQVEDATLWQAAPDWNDHKNERISTGTSSAGYSRALVRFDLDAVPAGATVVSASFSLLQNHKNGAGSTVHVLRATAPWSEETVTWSDFGSAFEPAPVASIEVVGGGAGARTVDVRALAQDWISGAAPNHGLVLDDPIGTGKSEFRSSESPYATERPALTVCYVSCDDGIQNGDETGFDCGGARCAPCNPDPGPPVGVPVEPAGTSLLIQVVSPDGPIAGATVRVDGAETVTDAEGNALLEGLAAGAIIAQVRAEGFAPGTITAELEPGVHGGTTASLLPLSPPIAFDADTGATVVVDAVQVEIPAGSLVDENGEPVTGAAEIVFAPIDPTTDDLESAPGPLVGIAGEGTEPVQLESGFMAQIALTQNGRPLQLAPGATAAVTFTLPPEFAATVAVGDLIPAWWFDHEAAAWRQDGFGVVEPSASDPSVLVWTVEVSHFTPWNCDRPWSPESCASVLVTDPNGTPLPGRPIVVRGLNYPYVRKAMTGPNGRVCVPVRRSSPTQIVVGSLSETQASTTIAPSANVYCNTGGCQAVTLTVPVPCGAPGTIQTCAYTGPAGSNNVGACKAGLRVCNGFTWGACAGQVTPKPEVCENAVDEDCDGQLNDGCSVCANGSTEACYTGPANTAGVGQCHAGSRTCVNGAWGPCTEQVTPKPEVCGNGLDDDCDNLNNEGCVCTVGQTQPCYNGPAGTSGVGQCTGGTRKCYASRASGFWGQCDGEVTPAPETCAANGDEDCDGLTNEEGDGCLCAPGATASCYSGPAGTPNVGACHAGTKTCDAQGTGYGPCVGEVTPAAETCATAVDDDCDGAVNEEGAGCVCIPTPSAPCGSGPVATSTIAAGFAHSLAVRSGGSVWAWGYNIYGQLGDGTTTRRSTPAQVQGLTSVIAITAGFYHSLAVRSDGSVWAWGYNTSGQLGDGTLTNRATPVQVQGLTNVTAIAAGHDHSLALRSDGSVWAWGWNASRQLGDGTTTNRSIPVQVQGPTSVTAIAAGHDHSLALRSDGSVWAWGLNNYGQLGDGTTLQRSTPVQVQGLTSVTAIAAGYSHSLAVRSGGSVWAWGYNIYGQLGNGTLTNRSTPGQVQGLTNVTAIAAGSYHAVAVRSDGSVRAWGSNTYGQLGDGTLTNRSTPVQVQGLTSVTALAAGVYYSLALRSDGSVRAWGYNVLNQLGDGTTTNRSTPVPVLGL